MKKSNEKTLESLKNLWKRKEELLGILVADHPVLIGTVYDTLRRCGNPTCHCAQKPSHLQTLVHFKKPSGQHCCHFVRQEDADALRRAMDLYRQWRDAMREFQTLQTRERKLLKVQIQKRGIQPK